MREMYSSLQVFGGSKDDVPGCTTKVDDGSVFEINGIRVTCFHTPCHTKGHILYYCEPVAATDGSQANAKEGGYQTVKNVNRCIFTGDTIFIGGCGRFFEGTAAEMAYAMSVMRDKIPQDTKMFCGHEYTEANLKFCIQADPENASIPAKAAEVEALKAAGWASVPTTVTEERSYNVFMRCFDEGM